MAYLILVTEDDQALRELACDILEMEGYEVIEAGSGEDALELFDQRGDDIDLLLTDLIMPSLTGAQISRQMRAKRPDLRVMIMTGYSQNVPGAAHELEADAWVLKKPFTPDELTRRVHQILSVEVD